MNKKISTGLTGLLALLAYWIFGINPPNNSTPTPSPTPIVISTPTPKTPTPTPIVTPTLLPTPEYPKCSLPPSDGKCEDNPTQSMYSDVVKKAQAELAVDHSDNPIVYTNRLAKMLQDWGYCATNGLEDEVWVKKGSNTFSEHFDVVTSRGEIWNKHAATCKPAKF